MADAVQLSPSTFDAAVASDTPTLVDFWEPWCGPCKMMLPVLDELATEIKGKADIAKVNVDEAQDLAAKFDINSIPCLIVFKSGKETARFVGTQKKDDLKKALLS